jgi:arabinogalactan endo-1,4-beta-galactosidase
VETAYNWTPGEYSKRPGPFPESPEGQKEFLNELNRVVQETPDGLGAGVFWWEPAVTGALMRRGMFDSDYNALPVITVFDKFTRH